MMRSVAMMMGVGFAAGLCAAGAMGRGGGAPADYDFDFVTIGDVNNPAYPGGPALLDFPRAGRGSVGYEYRIARTEVTTAQYLEFLNAVDSFAPDLAERTLQPIIWGAGLVLGQPPGQRWRIGTIANADRIPVGGISWRDSAMFVNWLHNDKQPTLAALQNGAYDTSTFGQVDPSNPFSAFTDQLTRSPGAKYWIPSLDEWLKAAHFDPNRSGPNQPGWWNYPYQSDSPPVSGLPGTPGAQTGADLEDFAIDFFRVPLKSYPEATSFYGLLDLSGGTSELTEEPVSPPGEPPLGRGIEGSFTTGGPGSAEHFDLIWRRANAETPGLFDGFPFTGLRVASSVPTPSSLLIFVAWTPFLFNRKRST